MKGFSPRCAPVSALAGGGSGGLLRGRGLPGGAGELGPPLPTAPPTASSPSAVREQRRAACHGKLPPPTGLPYSPNLAAPLGMFPTSPSGFAPESRRGFA